MTRIERRLYRADTLLSLERVLTARLAEAEAEVHRQMEQDAEGEIDALDKVAELKRLLVELGEL